jgi:hypothetical protein
MLSFRARGMCANSASSPGCQNTKWCPPRSEGATSERRIPTACLKRCSPSLYGVGEQPTHLNGHGPRARTNGLSSPPSSSTYATEMMRAPPFSVPAGVFPYRAAGLGCPRTFTPGRKRQTEWKRCGTDMDCGIILHTWGQWQWRRNGTRWGQNRGRMASNLWRFIITVKIGPRQSSQNI